MIRQAAGSVALEHEVRQEAQLRGLNSDSRAPFDSYEVQMTSPDTKAAEDSAAEGVPVRSRSDDNLKSEVVEESGRETGEAGDGTAVSSPLSPAPHPLFAWPCDRRGRVMSLSGSRLDAPGTGSQGKSALSPLSTVSPREDGGSVNGAETPSLPLGGADAFLAAVAAANAAVASVAGHTPGGAFMRSAAGIAGSSLSDVDFGIDAGCNASGGVPRREVEVWCAQVASELQTILASVDAKMEIWRAKMAEKDQVIRRLHWKLKQTSVSAIASSNGARLAGSLSVPGAGAASSTRSPPRASTNRSGVAGNRGGIPGSPSGATRGLAAAQSVDGLSQIAFPGSSRASRSGSLSPLRNAVPDASSLSNGRIGGEDRAPRSRRATVDPVSAAAVSLQSPTAATSRKSQMPREAAEKVQILYLRQEIAQLRRQNAELQGQVRTGDAQVENLNNMVKEMQVAQQRQLGYCRRQLNIRDESLQAMQEELHRSRAASGCGPTLQSSGSGAGTSWSPTGVVVSGIAGMASASGGSSITGNAASGPPSSSREGGSQGDLPSSRSTAVSGSRRVPNETQSSTVIVASNRVAAATSQAPRLGRRVAAENAGAGAGDRGSSITRSSSAFSRHKDQMAARRVIVAAAAQASGSSSHGSQMSRVFSPRSRQGHQASNSSSRVGMNAASASSAVANSACPAAAGAALASGTAASIAQAAQAAAHAAAALAAAHVDPQAPQSAAATPAVGIPAARSSSVEARTRSKIHVARRSLRRP